MKKIKVGKKTEDDWGYSVENWCQMMIKKQSLL